MPTTIRMPQLGETVADGTILRWAKQVGDEVAEGDVLVEIATDKVDTEVPSPSAGTILELLVAEGETVDVGAPIAVLSGDDEPAASPAPTPAPAESVVAEPPAPAPTPTPSPAPAVAADRARRLSPVVRRLAVEHDLDLASVTGTGAGGRIKRSDVLAALEAPAPSPPAPEPAPAREDSMVSETLARKDVLTPAVTKALADKGLEASQVPASGLGGRLTRADVEGFSGSPAPAPVPTPAPTPNPSAAAAAPSAAPGFAEVEVDFERIARVRGSISEVAFVARAALDAIRATAGVDGPLGFVVGDDAGIAVLADAGDLRLEGLARRIAEATPTDAPAGIVIAHPGALGATRSVPSMPTSGAPLLSVNAVRRQPAVVAGPTGEESLAIRSIGALGLVWDATTLTHGTALGFLQRVRDNLESWAWEQELT